jgi:anti-sigma factor RsiW
MLDLELSDAAATDLVQHLASCRACAAEFASLLALRGKLARLVPDEMIDPALLRRVDAAITPPAPLEARSWFRSSRRPAWFGGLGALGGFTVAAVLGLLMVGGSREASTFRAVADAGLRQTIPAHAVMLANNRPGGADAWFARRHLAQPPVPDLTKAGFTFAGCRTDIIAGHAASILVYRHAKSDITLIVWPSNGESAHPVRIGAAAGETLTYWNNGTLEFWVAGQPRGAVQRFAAAYRTKS